jgi:hypothetical protein
MQLIDYPERELSITRENGSEPLISGGIPSAIRSREVAQGLSPSVQRRSPWESSGFFPSGISGASVEPIVSASRNRDPRFPDRIRAVQTAGTRVRRSRRVGDRGIESPVHMTTGIAISRNAISRRVQGQSGDHQG